MSTTQRLLFDAEAGIAARDTAIDQVGRNAPSDVRAALSLAIHVVASNHRTFTTDHVWACVPPQYRDVADPRVIGAAMVSAAREGIVERLPGVFLASDMVCCHRRPKQVWQSLLWRAGQ